MSNIYFAIDVNFILSFKSKLKLTSAVTTSSVAAEMRPSSKLHEVEEHLTHTSGSIWNAGNGLRCTQPLQVIWS